MKCFIKFGVDLFSPWERDVVDGGEDFLVSYHIVDPFHETNHISKTKVLSGQGIIDGGIFC